MIFSYLLNMQSHPSWVCGLKLSRLRGKHVKLSSHPSWVCGLKRRRPQHLEVVNRSHPSWVCGLKQYQVLALPLQAKVTPFVGVWIETRTIGLRPSAAASHPSWVCGLKHSLRAPSFARSKSHPSWVCGLKRYCLILIIIYISHTLRGCVD